MPRRYSPANYCLTQLQCPPLQKVTTHSLSHVHVFAVTPLIRHVPGKKPPPQMRRQMRLPLPSHKRRRIMLIKSRRWHTMPHLPHRSVYLACFTPMLMLARNCLAQNPRYLLWITIRVGYSRAASERNHKRRSVPGKTGCRGCQGNRCGILRSGKATGDVGSKCCQCM